MMLRKIAPALVAAFVGLRGRASHGCRYVGEAGLQGRAESRSFQSVDDPPARARRRHPQLGSPSTTTRRLGTLTTTDTVVPELDITYFFTKNWAAELILGVTKHHVTGTDSIAGVDVGKAWLLPPTLTL